MMALLASLESSTFSTWLRESNTIWAYPTILTLHTVGLALLVGANTALDLRLLGVAPGIPLSELVKSFKVMWIGFWINAVSGVMLFAADATSKGTTKIFMWKLGIIAVSVINIILIKRVVYGRRPSEAIATVPAKLLAVTSLVLWVAAITAGRLMAYVQG
jgi:hypothetical protein